MIECLKSECIRRNFTAANKADVLHEIAGVAKKSDVLSGIDQKIIEEKLVEREQLSSTGMAGGIAIPHCSFDGIDDFVVGLILLEKEIDFDSFDGKKTRFVFFIIGPKENRNKHIKILSSISKLSKDRDLLKKVAAASSEMEINGLLQKDAEGTLEQSKIEKCQLTIHVQNEGLFGDVLEILSSELEGTVSVVDATSAGMYLHKLPLFSSFWNETDKSYCKLIIAVIDKRFVNDTIRRINMVRPENGRGMLLSVCDLIYVDGSIDF
jgi:nitrogen PTS system EIIA component